MGHSIPSSRGAIYARLAHIAVWASLGAACSSSSTGAKGSAEDAGSGGTSSGGAGAASSGGNTSVGGNATGGAANGGAGTSNGGNGAAAGGGGGNAGGASTGGAMNTGGSLGYGGSSGNNGDSGVALANPAPGSKFFIGANFWNIDWEGSDDFFQSNVDFTTTQNPWKPELLSDLAPYKVLRFMDWNQTNTSDNTQAVWSTRKQKTDMQNEPVAFEWQIDLCNRTKKDYWLNVPHEGTPDYWSKLATLVHDQLDPSLRVYVEWSNEVWNSGFPQNAYAAGKASDLGLSGSMPSASYYVYASVRMYEAFEAVFGKGSPRLVKVLSGQAAWTGPCESQMTALGDSTINPNGTKPDFYAIAPYFSGTSIQDLDSSISTVTGWTSSSKTCATSGGVPLISYEGGSDSFSAGSGCTTLQHDSGMHDLYTSYLDAISGAGMTGPFMQYTHTGSCWGLKEKTGDSLATSPKYAAVLDFLAAHP
jgi:hypothetical protein